MRGSVFYCEFAATCFGARSIHSENIQQQNSLYKDDEITVHVKCTLCKTFIALSRNNTGNLPEDGNCAETCSRKLIVNTQCM